MYEGVVSVIIPTFQRTKELKRAIESVLNQTYSNIEIIVVDDNREKYYSDQVKRITNHINDPRIKLVKNQRNLGCALSRNEGIKIANGKYITFLDDDDEYYPDKIKKQIELFSIRQDPKLALVYCYCNACNEEGSVIKLYSYDYVGKCLFQAMLDCISAPSQWMVKKDCAQAIGGFDNVRFKEEMTFLLKLLLNNYEIDRVPIALTKYYEDCGPCLSNSSHENHIIGEEQFRTLCRNNYHLLSNNEKKEVEYSFARRLIFHYCAAHYYIKIFSSIITLLSVHPFEKKTIRTIKNAIRENLLKE